MTIQEYDQIKKQLDQKHLEGLAALETLYAITNGREPEPDLGPRPETIESRAGLGAEPGDPNAGTMARSGIRTRKYTHSAAWLAKHRR